MSDKGITFCPGFELGAGELVALGTDFETPVLHTTCDVAAGRVLLKEIGAGASRAPRTACCVVPWTQPAVDTATAYGGECLDRVFLHCGLQSLTLHTGVHLSCGTRPGGDSLTMASYSWGQTRMQLPHLVHLVWSMTLIPLFSSVLMASTGQDSTQWSQPL